MALEGKIFYQKDKTRPGLYIIVTIGTFFAFSANRDVLEIKDYLQKNSKVHVIDVTGKETPDKFYEINGKRAYLEIDGKPIEDYIKEKKLEKEK
ncbi:hypothetical protein HYX16_03180 [Candidatus Woesearchaeota archaeon]|nr:hypothetical protein [Candidatus Woesearchaeota archaeon]